MNNIYSKEDKRTNEEKAILLIKELVEASTDSKMNYPGTKTSDRWIPIYPDRQIIQMAKDFLNDIDRPSPVYMIEGLDGTPEETIKKWEAQEGDYFLLIDGDIYGVYESMQSANNTADELFAGHLGNR